MLKTGQSLKTCFNCILSGRAIKYQYTNIISSSSAIESITKKYISKRSS